MSHFIRNLSLTSILVLTGCSQAPLRATVDSYGETPLEKTKSYYFDEKNISLLEKQATQDCKIAAKEAQVNVVEQACPECNAIELHMRLVGREQVIRSSPGFGSWFVFFGGGAGLGLGMGTGSNVSSSEQTGREITLLIYADPAQKKRAREIQVRSVGREDSVNAVAYEMCQAAFRDFPQNIKGRFYEVEYKKK